MSDRGRVVLIFGIVALIAGGAGFYFFKIHQPKVQLEAAQAEIATWETRYQEARACLLGKTPGSTKTSEALAIREMAPDPWDRGKCTPLVSKLSRGIANDTGIDAIEAAWAELEKAAQRAALAFATHVGSSTTVEVDPLPKALDDLDASRGKLRTTAKLSATEQTGTPLAPAQIVPLVDGKDPVSELIVDALPSAHGLVLFGKTANRQVQVALEAGGTPKVARVGAGSIRAVPDLSWGATAGMLTVKTKGKTSVGEVKAGAMDAEGVITTPTALALTVPIAKQGGLFDDPGGMLEPGDQVGSIMLASVAGSLAEGAFAYGGYQTLVIARAKANAITADPPIKIDVATASTDVDGRIAIVWTTLDKISRALLVRKGGEDAFELPSSFAGPPCMTSDRVWLMANGPEVFAFGGGKPLARYPVAPFTGLQGCTADAALVRKRDRPSEIEICADQCRKVQIPSGAPSSAAVTVVGGKLRAIAAHAGVLGVWSEDKKPVFYALPMQAKPVLAHEWPAMALSNGKVIDILARGEKTFVVIRIPAP
ncbi:MAG TPA: hypothetical protein VIV11_34225 [Kofleriaceae bacterium]